MVTPEAGATYTGPFLLPRKEGSGWIVSVVNTRPLRQRLPPFGVPVP